MPKATSFALSSCGGSAKKAFVGRIGAGPAALDIVDAQPVQGAGKGQLVGRREVDALRLCAVAQRGIEQVDAPALADRSTHKKTGLSRQAGFKARSGPDWSIAGGPVASEKLRWLQLSPASGSAATQGHLYSVRWLVEEGLNHQEVAASFFADVVGPSVLEQAHGVQVRSISNTNSAFSTKLWKPRVIAENERLSVQDRKAQRRFRLA